MAAPTAAAAACLLLLLSVPVSSEPDERQATDADAPCPAVCTCHQTLRSHVPIVRWHETGDRDDDSQHHWNFYHQNEGLNHSATETGDGQDELVEAVVCVLQQDTDVSQLMASLPADTQFLSLLQAPDMHPVYLREDEFASLHQLQGLEIQGFHTHDDYVHEQAAASHLHGNDFAAMLARADRPRGLLGPGARQAALVTLSDTALRQLSRLQFVSLEYVLLSPSPAGPASPRYQVQELEGVPRQLLVQQQPEVVPYDEFRLRAAPRYSNFANLTSLRFLRLAHAGLEEITWQLFEGLTALQQLIVEHQQIRILPDFAFYGCPNLRRLSLANNLLTVNMKSFAGLLDLEELDLSNNLISELTYISFAPFPRLRELRLQGNPTDFVYPGAFEMMNRTEVLSLGAADVPLTLVPQALDQLVSLRELVVANVSLAAMTGAELAALPQLVSLELHGRIPRLEFDAFRASSGLQQLDMSRCRLEELSQDAFSGLQQLSVLDLSHNLLTELPSEVFSGLDSLREVYLHHNLLSWLSADVLGPVRPKLFQLHHNPWDCNCHLAFLSAAMTNKARRSWATVCRWDSSAASGRVCEHEHRQHLSYDARLEPRCHTPPQYRHWGLYEVLQRELRCHTAAPPPPVARSAQYLPDVDDAEYQMIVADDDAVLLDDSEDYGDHEAAAAAGWADEERALAQYSADDYDYVANDPASAAAAEAATTSTEGYATISPELFAKLSKKAQKLELERMNPKFRKHYNL